MRPWLYLLLAGLLEMAWPVGLRYSQGWTRLWPSALALVLSFFSFYFLTLAVQTIPVGTGYAVWTGTGAVGAVLLGIFFFGEEVTPARILCLTLIVVGILGLKFTSGEQRSAEPGTSLSVRRER